MREPRALLAIALASLLSIAAAGDPREDFKRVYGEYHQHLAADNEALALPAAETAYEIGTDLFGAKSLNAANLALNYAHLLNQSGYYDTARKVLKGKLKPLLKKHGKAGQELLPMYMELGMAHFDAQKPGTAVDHFRKAAELVVDEENPLYTARINVDIASHLIQRRGELVAHEFVDTALSIYKQKLQSDDVRLGMMAFLSGKFLISDGQFARARDDLALAIEAFESGENASVALDARKSMVAALANLGQSDAATEHCLVIGRALQNQDMPQLPIYRARPDYPRRALRRRLTGNVRLSFTVTAAGKVDDPEVLASSSDVFDQAALDAIRMYRYAPHFVNGTPVAVDYVEYTISFGRP